MKILLAPNSFKECADSVSVLNYFKKYLTLSKDDEIISKPVSDGGDGFLNVCKNIFDLKIIKYKIRTPYDESLMDCEIGYDEKSKKIYIESAGVLGLRLIPKDHRKPMSLNSKGMGDLLKKILEDVEHKKLDVEKVIIGVGGTGTNDLSLGMCSVFNFNLFDVFNKHLEIHPGEFHRVKKIEWENPNLPFEIVVIADVDNPLLGKNGSTRIYGKQKGASGGEIEVLELGFTKVIHYLERTGVVQNPDELPGAGGGLAAGLQIFFNAKIRSARNFILYDLGLKNYKDNVDAVITGEGSFDDQTLMGKGAGIITNLFNENKSKIFLCCGIIKESTVKTLSKNIIPIQLSDFFEDSKEAILKIEKGIKLATERIQKELNS